MSYNLSFTDTSNNLGDIAVGISQSMGPVFGGMILFLVWLTFYALLARNGASTAFVGSGLVATGIGVSMLFGGLITWQTLIVPVIVLILGMMYLFWNDRK